MVTVAGAAITAASDATLPGLARSLQLRGNASLLMSGAKFGAGSE
jgi:hypothetical protein